MFIEPILKTLEDSDKTLPVSVADFGGGTGIMLSQVNQQLHETGFQESTPILIDIDEKKIEHAKTAHPELEAKVGDIFQLPLENNSIDIGVSRNMIQYFPSPSETSDQPNQFDILKEIYRVMKPDSTLILVWPGAYKNQDPQDYLRAITNDNFWSIVTWHRTNDEKEYPLSETEKVRQLTPGETMSEFAQKAGFEVESGEEEDWIEFRYTDEAVISRFGKEKGVPEDNQQWIRNSFSPDHIRHLRGLDAIDWQGKKAVRLPISRLVLKKK